MKTILFLVVFGMTFLVHGQEARYVAVTERATFSNLPAGLSSEQALLLLTGAVSEIVIDQFDQPAPAPSWFTRQFSWAVVYQSTVTEKYVFVQGQGIAPVRTIAPARVDPLKTAGRLFLLISYLFIASSVLSLANLMRKESPMGSLIAFVVSGALLVGVAYLFIGDDRQYVFGSLALFAVATVQILIGFCLLWHFRLFKNL